MPQLANITVKKKDGTTDITYTGVVPSAGDKTPAIFRSNTVGASIGQRPELRITSQYNGDKTARRATIEFSYPSLYTETTTGRVLVARRLNFSLTASIPVDMPDSDVNEAVYQGFNLLAAALIKDSVASGYAPT